jgi:hypothetical protein
VLKATVVEEFLEDVYVERVGTGHRRPGEVKRPACLPAVGIP